MNIVVDRARVTIPQPATPDAMVTEGNNVVAGVNASPYITTATSVAAAATAFAGVDTALDANNKAKAKAKADLATAETNEAVLVRRWGTKRRGLSTAIDDFSDGSKDTALSFSVQVEEKTARPIAETPANLHPMKTKKPTWAGCRWDPTAGAHGYMLQHASNPADPSTYSAAIAMSKARYWLTGQTSGTTVYFRVLACDEALPNGQTAYTAWVAVLVT